MNVEMCVKRSLTAFLCSRRTQSSIVLIARGYCVTYLLFVTIFPHLIAGPIINHSKMIPQFVRAENFSISLVNLAQGGALFSVGLFKKVMIADQLSPLGGGGFC